MKTIWFNSMKGEFGDYVKDQHGEKALKFLCWDDIILIGGPRADGFKYHHDLLDFALVAVAEGSDLPACIQNGDPIGAGNCRAGFIVSWESEGLHIRTPSESRQRIADSLGLRLRVL